MAHTSRSYGADFPLLYCSASKQFTVVQAGGKVLLFRFAGHSPICLRSRWLAPMCRCRHPTHTCTVSWAESLAWLGHSPVPFTDRQASSWIGPTTWLSVWLHRVLAQQRGEGAGWTWVLAEGLLLNAPCMVSGACGGDGDWPKCCEGLTPQGSVGTGRWWQQNRQEFMKWEKTKIQCL